MVFYGKFARIKKTYYILDIIYYMYQTICVKYLDLEYGYMMVGICMVFG